MLITVTQEHINKGKKDSCYRCPVALAMAAAGYSEAGVGNSLCGAVIGGRYRRMLLPQFVQGLIVAFDRTGAVEPFTFELDLEPA